MISGVFSNLVLALTAGIALFLAWRQIAISRELGALEAYENYHIICLQYPEMASGKVNFGDFDHDKLRQYEMFVLYTLMVAERIFALFPHDKEWRFSIEDDVRMHVEFIRSEHFVGHLRKQGWSILHIITAVMNEDERADDQARPKIVQSPAAETPISLNHSAL